MKKIFQSFLIITSVSLSFIGCANKEPTSLPLRTYIFEDSEDIIKPNISLKNDSEFIFTFSALSSYWGIGSYEIDDDQLILNTSDDKYHYLFTIQDDSLIYDSKKSSSFPWNTSIPDGAIFK